MTSARLELDENVLKEAEELLKDIPNGYKKALSRSINRAMQEGRTEAVRSVRAEYSVKARTIRPTFNITKAKSSNIEASLESKGSDLPLEEYSYRPKTDTTGSKRRVVKVGVKKGGLKPLGQGFVWGGKVMRREGRTRLPVSRAYGPAIPVTLNNDAVVGKVVDKMSESVNKRLAHETERILSGNG